MRLIAMYSANDMEPTANKLRASIVILELKYGDIVAVSEVIFYI